ncbi:MAG: hypothetical protein K8F91_03035, partial [Candidatus Obscuribacterales bacterium]|nr:hypothetical protein [Candidatus Obscuribacterales bacterium]
MSIGAITIRAACVISQLIIAGAFLSLAFLRDSTVASLFGLGLDSIIVEGVYGAFGRYLAWMVLATIVVCGFTVVDLKGRSLVMRQALLIYGSLAFFLFYLIFSRCLQFPWSVDDSYIDYRYVYNWVNGVSFDYNPGQKVMGFTSHLHLALLSLGYSCFANIELPVISQTINVLLQVVSYFLVFVFMRCVTASLSTGVIAAAVLALFPYMTQETIGGKESPLVSFLILASLLAMQKRRLHLCAWLAALLLLTRPEGGLWLL